MLVHRYWQCLGADLRVNGTGPLWGMYSDSVRTTAIVCTTADLSTVMGLFAACQLIGWRKVLRVGVMVFSLMSSIAGILLLLIGLMLRIDQVGICHR